MIADSAMHSATTAKGGTFRAFSSSWAQYGMRPAGEWNPWSLFRAMTVPRPCPHGLKDFPAVGRSPAESKTINTLVWHAPNVRPLGARDGRDRRRVHRKEADDELRPRGRHILQRRHSRGHREGARTLDLSRRRRRRDRPGTVHPRCGRPGRAHFHGTIVLRGRPRDERQHHRNRAVQVRADLAGKTFIGSRSSRGHVDRRPADPGDRGVPRGNRRLLPRDWRRRLPDPVHDARPLREHQGRHRDEPDRSHRDLVGGRFRLRTGPSHELAPRDVPRGGDDARRHRGRPRRPPGPGAVPVLRLRSHGGLRGGGDGPGPRDREATCLPGRFGAAAHGTAQAQQRLLRPRGSRRLPVPGRATPRGLWRERRGRPLLRPPRGRRRLHQGAGDEHPDAGPHEGRGGHQQLHDRCDRRGERLHLLLPRPRRSGPRGDGDHRRLLGDEPRHPPARALESLERPLRLRGLPRRHGTRDAPQPPPGDVDLIAARGGLRLVQRRVSALRRAVVAEVEDMNRLIYHILRGGVVVSVAVLVFGFVLVAMTGRPIPERSIPPRSLGDQLYHFTPEGYLSLGVLILIFTPVVRVLLSLLSFVKEGDRMYVLMTLIVFVNLITSLFLLA